MTNLKKIGLPLIVTVLAVVTGMAAWKSSHPDVFSTPHLPVTEVEIGNVKMRLWVASTLEEQERGLMDQRHLATDQIRGMLFVFPGTEQVTFWMKHTPEPLWLLFIQHNKVVKVIYMAPCLGSSCPLYPSPGAVETAIELSPSASNGVSTWIGKRYKRVDST